MKDRTTPVTFTIEQIREAASRLHSSAYYGAKTPGLAESACARFSIPRQPNDDDEIVYAAIEELARLRTEAEQAHVVTGSLREARAIPHVQNDEDNSQENHSAPE